ncbi:MAG: hypothetical protein R3248_12460 [Candidatus Promineifilaceae bacterium]|nr:hypothetical protein [Candidatus Promineifilaceae bacterium]
MTDSHFVYAGILFAGLALLAGFGLAGLWWGAAAAAVVATLWAAGHARKKRWAASIGLFVLLFITAVGLVVGLAPGWGIVALGAALAAWEFDYFRRVLDSTVHADSHVRVERRHLLIRRHRRRTLTVILSGVLVAGAATVIQIQFGFGLALLLAVVSLAGISRAVHFLR